MKALDAIVCRFVPGLRKNFLSLARATQAGYEVTFIKNRSVAKNAKGNITFVAQKVNGLYVLPTNVEKHEIYATDIRKTLNIPELAMTVEL